ncbi:MAG: efflux RND transporter periplasmic adaptor subunit [Candidatus Poribacteria bacterium]
MKKLLVVIIILALVGIGAWRVSAVLKARAQSAKLQEKLPTAVEVEVAKLGTIQEELSLVGNIVADSEVAVFPKTMGKIEQQSVNVGSNVSKGNIMAKLEDKELTLRVKQAEVMLDTARTGYNQAKALAEVRVKSQVAQAEAGLVGADAALKQIQDIAKTRVSSQLDQAQAGLEALKTNLKKIKDGARLEEKKQIEAMVQQAKANMDNSQADLERMEKLFNDGAISKQTLDGARTRTTVANSQYDAATQQLKLVEIGARPEDIQAMELQIKAAESGLTIAKSMSDSKSWEQDIEMTKSRYDQAKAILDSAKSLVSAKSWEAEIAGAEAGVKQADTGLALAKEALSYATVTAPISGTVSKRNLDTGSMANPAMPMFTIVSMNIVKAIVEVPEANLSGLPLNGNISVTVTGITEPVKGQITLVSPVVKPASRTATVEITIDNPSHKLKPGAFAKVNIPLKINNNVVLVGRSAIIDDKESKELGSKYAFIVDKDKIIKRKVEIGIAQGDTIEVVSGIQAGEKVVTAGQNLVKDGEIVKISGQ